MTAEISLQQLVEQPGVIGAVRWKSSDYATNMAATPVLLEYAGDLDADRAARLMNNSEAAGASVMGIAMLNKTANPQDQRNVFPVDAYYVNGQYTSMAATFNRVAVILDNSTDYEPREIIGLMNQVAN